MIVGKPTKNSRKLFPYRILGKDQYLYLGGRKVTEKGEEINAEYLDIAAPMLYLDSVENTDIREMIRILMFHIAQRFTPEEVKEILTVGVSNKFINGDFTTIGTSEEENRYANMIHSFLTENNVRSFLVGEQSLYSTEDHFNEFAENLKKEIKETEKSREMGENREPAVENSKDADSSQEQPSSLAADDGFLSQVQHTKDKISDLDISPLSKAFMLSMLQSGEMGALTKDDIDNYVCTMLHGIGLVLPRITETEIEEMARELKRFIDKRLEIIMSKHIAHFERVEERDEE